MTFKLTRDKTLEEIAKIEREVDLLRSRIAACGIPRTTEFDADFDELEENVLFARKLAQSNQMDFKQIEAELPKVRAWAAEIKKSLDTAEESVGSLTSDRAAKENA